MRKLHYLTIAATAPLCAALATGCGESPQPSGACGNLAHRTRNEASARTPVPDLKSWIGLYSSPVEIRGFSGTVLAIEDGFQPGALRYRMTFYSDSVMAGEIREKEKSGDVLADGNRLCVPLAYGFVRGDRTQLSADITRYTRIVINNRTVLLRDDALEQYRRHHRLYDYGILIKVSQKVEFGQDLGDVKHDSIKRLYDDPAKPWHDPFVNGPNQP